MTLGDITTKTQRHHAELRETAWVPDQRLKQAAEKPGFAVCSGDFTSPQMQYFQSRRGGIKPPLRVFPQPVKADLIFSAAEAADTSHLPSAFKESRQQLSQRLVCRPA
jgi:hypothetical protein